MNLESLPKFYSPKSPKLDDSTPATRSDALTVTDVMAAQGMIQSRAELGFSAFLGKAGISVSDREKAICLLAEYALTHCDKVAALRKLDETVKLEVMRILATFAFEDYSRSAASVKTCDCCHGKGLIEAEVFTMKSHYTMRLPQWAKDLGQSPGDFEIKRQVKEIARLRCKSCKGKGVVSAACNDCKGRAQAVNKEKSEIQGVPVLDDCQRCGGRGYERVPSTEAFRVICTVTSAITLDTWKKSVKKFYDSLAVMLSIEEGEANGVLQAVTR
ncbi:antitermination protein [Pantoea agglomerans]|uniref:antitermination protein n=1 Tax=Enterobacter agglomerans TaxID=549 RepID=UPI002413C1C9|nr:antitermination protein [Pantoea agglomerans]